MKRPLSFLCIAVATASCSFLQHPSCHADLFALGNFGGMNQIYRINSDSGELLRTYPMPFIPPIGVVRSGMAFDGRVLYVSHSFGADFFEIHRFDVVEESWLDPVIGIGPIIAPGFAFVAGLGFLRKEHGQSLLAVEFNQFSPGTPLQVIEVELIDTYPGAAMPVGTFSAELRGLGLDVDPLTNEIWMAVRNPTTAEQSLKRIDLQGNVLSELPLVLGPPLPAVRGVGFDDGRLYVVNAARTVFEIDRTDGSVVRSFMLPVAGTIGSLTGGTVVPEPGTAALVFLASAAAVAGRSIRRLRPR